jgi:hypothetical protein
VTLNHTCTHPGCPAKIADHRWGRTKANGWFFSKDGEAWCPDHVPRWVATWRAKEKRGAEG